ncbi:MAG: ketoacyl-ACP synthase III [Candidatus Omnitrophica bacterium]|nr:ketoacyl-ACP synthase III [Candidatus Omnitrophota bacterium]MCM8828377.1 ketoacyl-ACP synthase III [Candidatus Omnitrophota bacterium]
MGANIIGIGSYVPERILTNADLEKLVDTSDEWIVTRTGIKERRICPEDKAASDLGTEAARRAIADAGIEAGKIEMIICATITGDMVFPSTACIIQNNLGIENVPCFDISAACSGFIYGLEIARNLIDTGRYNKILVVAAECMSRVTDYTDRSTCVLLGDGSAAVVIERTEDRFGILDTYLGAAGKFGNLLYVPAGGSRMPATHRTVEEKMHFMKMEGSSLFRIAVVAMGEAVKKVLERNGFETKDVSLIIPHQANIRIIQGVARMLDVPMDRVFLNIEKYGNMSAASVGVALDEAVKAKKINKGNLLCMVSFGAGLTWAANIIRWGKDG